MSLEQHSTTKISSNTNNQEEGTAVNTATNLSNISNPLNTGGNDAEIGTTGKNAERNEIRTYTFSSLILNHRSVITLNIWPWNDENFKYLTEVISSRLDNA